MSLTPVVKVLLEYIENCGLWYDLSEPNFWKIKIWDNCTFVNFWFFFGYKMQNFLDIHIRIAHNAYFISQQQLSTGICNKMIFDNFVLNLLSEYMTELPKWKSLKCHISVNFYPIFKCFAPFWSGKNALSNEYPFDPLGFLFKKMIFQA